MLPITKKPLSLSIIAAALVFAFTACSDDTTGTNGEEESQLETHTVEDIPADTSYTGNITYYSLRENSLVEESDSASTDWDIAFSGTTIYTNNEASGPGSGGAIVLDQSFDATTMAPSEGYAVDTTATNLAIPTGSDNGWYNYNTTTHIVTPLPDKTIVLRTADGENYAKLKVLSYYKGHPDVSSDEFNNNPDEYPSRYYTFEYAIQLNGSRELQ